VDSIDVVHTVISIVTFDVFNVIVDSDDGVETVISIVNIDVVAALIVYDIVPAPAASINRGFSRYALEICRSHYHIEAIFTNLSSSRVP
jgi:hypothetical protein